MAMLKSLPVPKNSRTTTQKSQSNRKAKSHSQTIEERCQRVILGSEGFRTSQQNTVHHNQGDEQTERCIQSGDVCLHHHLKQCHERRNDYDEIGIRTMSGTRFLIREITTFEQINTNMVASPIPIPLMAEEVVPNVGHIPKRSTNVGFSLTIPFINTLKLFIVCSSPINCFQHLYCQQRQKLQLPVKQPER